MAFFIRRAIFIISVLHLDNSLLTQLSIQIIMSLLNLLLLIQWKPLITNFENNKEIFNEVTILGLSYFALTFTNAEPNPNTRAVYGLVYICLSLFNILVHLIILMVDTISNLISFIRRKVKNCRKKKTII